MADVKISGLPASTTPLAGTEVLPVVQGGVTKQVSVNNLTAGKTVSATQFTSTIATGTAPLVVSSTTEVANLRSANATSADTANQVKSNATTGLLQIAGPAAGQTRVMTTPDANFTAARTDAAQTFTGNQTFGTVLATTIDTNVAAAKVTLSGTTLAASGTDSNININITPKGTGQIAINSGAVGTPAIAPSGDLNTGIFFPAADTVAIAEGGAEAMRVDSSGNIGINTTIMNGKLNVKGVSVVAGAGGSDTSYTNTAINLNTTNASGATQTVATIPQTQNTHAARIVFTVTATNWDANIGYATACSVREILYSNYGGGIVILTSTELSNNSGSVNAGVISVALVTAASVSGTNILLQATPTITGAVGGTNAGLLTKVEVDSGTAYQTITF